LVSFAGSFAAKFHHPSEHPLSTQPVAGQEAKKQLRREMGFWDVLLFNIAAVLGPRWIALAAYNGTRSISLWILAALLFFIPSAFIVSELSSRFPSEGGVYVWAKEAFGEFHGFVAGWTYWIYTVFYFPALLMASMSMSAYVAGTAGATLSSNRPYLVIGSLVLLALAVWLNIIGLNIGKWLQNAGGVGTYAPLVLLLMVATAFFFKHGSVTHFTASNILPGKIDLGKVNFWSTIAFGFAGLELVAFMSEEIHEPHRTIPRAIFGSGILIAFIYLVGTAAVLVLLPSQTVHPSAGVFQALTFGSTALGLAFIGIVAAVLVTVGNAGGVGTTVAGVARIPFVVGIDRYMPAAFGRIHPRWRTPYVAMLVQAIASAIILVAFQWRESTAGAYQILIDATVILNFIPYLYMYAAAIRLAYRPDRKQSPGALLIPGGRPGAWLAGSLAFGVTLLSIIVAMIPPDNVENKPLFEIKLIGSTIAAVLIGLTMYWQGAKSKRRQPS
jgi:glutamate:GABA antiporter